MRIRKGPLLMLGATLAFTIMVACVKEARAEMDALEVIVWRTLVSVPLALALVWRIGLRVKAKKWLLARVTLGSIAMVFFFTAAKGLSVGDLSLVSRLQPIVVALVAPVVLGVAERAGDLHRAEQFATAAAEGGGGADNTLDALLVLARTAKRGGLIAAEQLALQKALQAAPLERRAFVHLELSKMFERRQKRTVPALVHALHTGPEEDEDLRDRRVHRLTKRLAKQNRKKPLRASLRFAR